MFCIVYRTIGYALKKFGQGLGLRRTFRFSCRTPVLLTIFYEQYICFYLTFKTMRSERKKGKLNEN